MAQKNQNQNPNMNDDDPELRRLQDERKVAADTGDTARVAELDEQIAQYGQQQGGAPTAGNSK